MLTIKDSYTDGGVRDGSPLKPAVLSPPNPKAGGRVSNGPVWVENLAKRANATLKDYAVSFRIVHNLFRVLFLPDGRGSSRRIAVSWFKHRRHL